MRRVGTGMALPTFDDGPVPKGTPEEAHRAALNLCSVAEGPIDARDVLEVVGLVPSRTPAARRPGGGRQYRERDRAAS